VGYPHDNKSREFVKKSLTKKSYLQFVRTSWQTFRDIKSEKEQAKLFHFK